MPELTHYERLLVSPRASASEIRDSYRRIAWQRHPDLNRGAGTADMAAINDSYRVLSNPGLRAVYDQWLAPSGLVVAAPRWPSGPSTQADAEASAWERVADDPAGSFVVIPTHGRLLFAATALAALSVLLVGVASTLR